MVGQEPLNINLDSLQIIKRFDARAVKVLCCMCIGNHFCDKNKIK